MTLFLIYLQSDDVSSFSSRKLFSVIILMYIPLDSLVLSFYIMENLDGFIPFMLCILGDVLILTFQSLFSGIIVCLISEIIISDCSLFIALCFCFINIILPLITLVTFSVLKTFPIFLTFQNATENFCLICPFSCMLLVFITYLAFCSYFSIHT